MWKTRLSPIVKSGKTLEPLTDRYAAFSNSILEPDEPKIVAYREKLLGPDLVAGYNEDYVKLKTIDTVGHERWENLDHCERGMWSAFYELENMVELLKEHLRTQKRDRESLRSKK